jgi:geranylgeranyl pyrophosphate synthase
VKLAEPTPFEEVISAGGEEIRRLMEGVERQLAQISSGYGDQLARSATSTLAAGGKRLRPLLVFVCGSGEATVREQRSLVRAAVSVELVHMATLVHDDVIDGAPMRRGRPTVYAASGRAVATATGDFLFSRAFSLLGVNRDPGQIRTLSDACLALARGELAQRRDVYAQDVDSERYLRRCELKTGSLFVASCRLGALAAGRAPSQVEALGRFGRQAGLAFQLLDDVLDVVGAPDQTGKQRGTDLLEGTTTLPFILASEADPGLAQIDLRTIDSRERAEEVCDRIAATDALEAVRRWATDLVHDAKAEVDGNLPPPASELLGLVADRIVERYK